MNEAVRNPAEPIIEIENLSISFFTRKGEIPAVMDFSCTVMPGEAMGIVGESGCGKSTVSLGIMREGRASHFDPDILDVFLANAAEFRAIAERFADHDSDIAAAEALALGSEKVQRQLGGAAPRKVIVVPDRLVNVVA